MHKADWVCRVRYNCGPYDERLVLMFATIVGRHDDAEGDIVHHWQAVAYPCDEGGRVTDWHYRYSLALNVAKGDYQELSVRLRLSLTNDMLPLKHIENL